MQTNKQTLTKLTWEAGAGAGAGAGVGSAGEAVSWTGLVSVVVASLTSVAVDGAEEASDATDSTDGVGVASGFSVTVALLPVTDEDEVTVSAFCEKTWLIL